MDDPDVFARLIPLVDDNNFALQTVRSPANRRFYSPATTVTDVSSVNGDDYRNCEGFEFRFSQKPNSQFGFAFGTALVCDIVVPSAPGLELVGDVQCALRFDKHHRLILEDIQYASYRDDSDEGKIVWEEGGTSVTYEGQGNTKRRDFIWVLSGDDGTSGVEIVIAIDDNLKFMLVVPPFDSRSAAFLERVRAFQLPQASRGDDGSLPFDCAERMPDRAILVKTRTISKNSRTVVSRVWDVSSGISYASKRFFDTDYSFRLLREVRALGCLQHDHIVQGILVELELFPRIILEYVPMGNLREQDNVSPLGPEDLVELLRQGTGALWYLHGQTWPIVHRNIRPENILVHSRYPRLHIKLSDFGLAGYEGDAGFYGSATRLGTPIYQAPETFPYVDYYDDDEVLNDALDDPPEDIMDDASDEEQYNVVHALINERIDETAGDEFNQLDRGMDDEINDDKSDEGDSDVDAEMDEEIDDEIDADDGPYDEKLADVWSLATVVYDLAHNLPTPPLWHTPWAIDGREYGDLVEQQLEGDVLHHEGCRLLRILAQTMLIVDPSQRSTAAECNVMARNLRASPCCGAEAMTVDDFDEDGVMYFTMEDLGSTT